MASSCLRYADIPHTSRLFLDFLYHFDRLSGFYAHNPFDAASYAKAAAAVHYPATRRAALVEALRRENQGSPLLDQLAQPDTVAVVTGQQVGLFSGPCYTIYKALTAVKLAAELNRQGIPAVPVFWLATEDHDFAEVNHAYSLSAANAPVRHEVATSQPDHTPVGGIPIAAYPVDELQQALAGLPFAGELLAAVAAAYRPGATLGDAFSALLKRLLAAFPLLYLDPMEPAIRQLAAPILRQAVERAPRLSERLLERNAQLEQAGYHAQVHVEAKTSLFFLLRDGLRLTLHRDGDKLLLDDTPLSPAELAAHGERLSPNALLRPVVQDYLLPTVAQVVGPAELAYLAQSEVLYEELERPAPVVAPRSAFTLVDTRAAKLLNRYSLSVRDCLDALEPLRERIARRLVPESLARSLEASRQTAATLLDRMVEEIAAFDQSLAGAAARSRAKILYQFSKIEAKTARAALRNNERAAAEAAYLFHAFNPDKHLQERFYTILPFLARNGFDLIARLYDEVRLDCPDHIVLEL
jgi:bacillithiol biosynthesis cysteine-adding enzyme BshC